LRNLFDQYVFGKKIKELGNHFTIRLQEPSAEELKQSKRAFLKLWIYDGVSREEILNYIKKNWKIIKILIKSDHAPKIKRFRKITNKKQNELIIKYNKLSIEKLRTLAAEKKKGVYREILISRLLKKEGFEMTFEAIKMVISRSKKRQHNI
jgi:hypothetical protein